MFLSPSLLTEFQAQSQVLIERLPCTAEMYDPVTDTWTVVASMNALRRSDAAVTPLLDGRILVVGGSAYAGAYIPVSPAAEVYDPVSDTWEATGPMVSSLSIG